MNDNSKTQDQKMAECKKVKIVLDDSGKPCSGLITDIVTECRKEKVTKEEQSKKPYSENSFNQKNTVYQTKQNKNSHKKKR